MKKVLLFTCAGILILSLPGCSIGRNLGEARALGDKYFEAIMEKDFESAVGYYSPRFLEEISKNEALKTLAGINTKLGYMVSYKFKELRANGQFDSDGSSTTYRLIYETVYSKGPAIEQLTIVKSEDGTKMEILSFNINSAYLLTY